MTEQNPERPLINRTPLEWYVAVELPDSQTDVPQQFEQTPDDN